MATPPPGVSPPSAGRTPRLRYRGPPSYASPPRWGFPALAWRWPTSVPGTPSRAPVSLDRVRVVAGHAVVALVALAVVAAFAGVAEVWRYVLLLRSREGALTKGVVDASDALVITGAILTIAFAVPALVLTLWWLFLARAAAADLAGHEPARPDWQVLVCLAVPGINLVVPGAVLAELEHAVLRRRAEHRVRPGRLVMWWWAVWVAGGLLFAGTLLWRLRDSVQAQADGVLITAVVDLGAVAVAVLTVLVVRRLSTLIAPIDPASVRFMRVVKVDGAPEPPLRPGRPAGAVR